MDFAQAEAQITAQSAREKGSAARLLMRLNKC